MSRSTRLVVLPLVAAVVGIAVGAIVMGLVLLPVRELPSAGSSWGDVGRFLVGVFLAVVTGVLVWVVGLARAARRLFDAGLRLGVVTIAVAAVFVVVVLAPVAVPAALANAVGPGMWLGPPLALTIPSLVFVLWDRHHALTGAAPSP